MKKGIFILGFVMLMSIFCSCEKKLDISKLIAEDRQTILNEFGEGYLWYESTVAYNDFLDEGCDGKAESLENVFAVITVDEGGQSGDSYVIKIKHTKNGAERVAVHDLWVGDTDLNKSEIILNFDDAFARMMASNYPKPHSRYVVLRNEVGAVDANTQFIFGNEDAQLYVDAVTGEVRDTNPHFGE